MSGSRKSPGWNWRRSSVSPAWRRRRAAFLVLRSPVSRRRRSWNARGCASRRTTTREPCRSSKPPSGRRARRPEPPVSSAALSRSSAGARKRFPGSAGPSPNRRRTPPPVSGSASCSLRIRTPPSPTRGSASSRATRKTGSACVAVTCCSRRSAKGAGTNGRNCWASCSMEGTSRRRRGWRGRPRPGTRRIRCSPSGRPACTSCPGIWARLPTCSPPSCPGPANRWKARRSAPLAGSRTPGCAAGIRPVRRLSSNAFWRRAATRFRPGSAPPPPPRSR